MAQEYTQKQLEEMVNGKEIDPTIEFFEQAIMDPVQSKAAGKRVYNDTIMIKRIVPGVTDYVAQRATAQDIRRWPEEYAAFQRQVQSRKSPGLEVLFGISNVEKQELIDRGFSTIERLALADNVPEHLVHLQAPAQRVHMALMAEEIHRDHEESIEEEIPQEEGVYQEGRPERHDAIEGRGDREGHSPDRGGPVPPLHRQDERGNEQQQAVQEVRSEGLDSSPRRDEENRRKYNPSQIDNWKVDFTWSP